MGYFDTLGLIRDLAAPTISTTGAILGLPEMGISEAVGSLGKTQTTAQGDFKWVDNGAGGVNYYLNGQPITREQFTAGTGQDAGAIEAWVAGASRNEGMDFSGLTNQNTGGSNISALQQSIADLEATQAAVRAQFEPLYAKYLEELQSGLTTGKNDLRKSYFNNAESNDKAYGEGLQNIQRGYAARGIGDSSYKENAVQGLSGDFNRIYGDLTDQFNRGNSDLEKQVNDKKASAEAMKNNFYNPTRPQFTNVSDVASYAGQLGSQLDTARNQLSNAQLSAPTLNNPAASDKLFQEYVGGMADNNISMGDAQKGIASKGLTDPSYDAYLSYIYGGKEGDPYKYLNPQKAKYFY